MTLISFTRTAIANETISDAYATLLIDDTNNVLLSVYSNTSQCMDTSLVIKLLGLGKDRAKYRA